MAYLDQHKQVDNFLVSLVMDHKRYMPLVQIIDNIIEGAAELTWVELEILGLEVSNAMGSGFCSGIRTGMITALTDSKGEGRDLKVLKAFARKLTADKGDDRDLEVLKVFARKLTLNADQVNEEDIIGIRKAGWKDQTIEDVVGWVSVMKAYSTLDQGLGFGALPKEAFDEMGQGTVSSNGYVEIFNHFVNG